MMLPYAHLRLAKPLGGGPVGTDLFLTHEIIDIYRIGLGDETILVGRLIEHDGRQKNTPIVRFGNISLMADPAEPIKTKYGDLEGFLVECRSLSGFSGSPVFVMTTQVYREDAAEKVVKHRKRTMGYEEQESDTRNRGVMYEGSMGPWLLGIDWGHFPLWGKVLEKDERIPNMTHETKYCAETNTGIACVSPAWKILDTLNVDELVKERSREDKKIAKQLAQGNCPVNNVPAGGQGIP